MKPEAKIPAAKREGDITHGALDNVHRTRAVSNAHISHRYLAGSLSLRCDTARYYQGFPSAGNCLPSGHIHHLVPGKADTNTIACALLSRMDW